MFECLRRNLVQVPFKMEQLVVRELMQGDKTGDHLLACIRAEVAAVSGPTFYHFMKELIERGVVISRDESSIIAGVEIHQRWYTYSDGGIRLEDPSLHQFRLDDIRFGGARPGFA